MIRKILQAVTTLTAAGFILAFLSTTADAAGFMKFEGVKGESTDKEHSGWIEILSFEHGSTQWRHGSRVPSIRPERGRAATGTLTIRREYGRSSPHLYKLCGKGENIRKVTVHLAGPDQNGGPVREYVLQDVTLRSVSLTGGSHPTEELTLNFSRIAWGPKSGRPDSGEMQVERPKRPKRPEAVRNPLPLIPTEPSDDD